MEYTISEVSQKTNLSAHTLRFYEKQGLLPFVERSSSGKRQFKESDLERLELICCLKNTGMTIKQIKEYIDLCIIGDETLDKRRQIFMNHRDEVIIRVDQLAKNLEHINCKIKYYNDLCNKDG